MFMNAIAFGLVLLVVGQVSKGGDHRPEPKPTFREDWMMLTQPNGELQTSYRRCVLLDNKRQVARYEHYGEAVLIETSGKRVRVWFPGTKELLLAPETFTVELQRLSRQAWFDTPKSSERTVRGPIVIEQDTFGDGATLKIEFVIPQLGIPRLVARAEWKRPDGSGGWIQNVASGTAKDLSLYEIPTVECKASTTGDLVARLERYLPIIFPPGSTPGKG